MPGGPIARDVGRRAGMRWPVAAHLLLLPLVSCLQNWPSFANVSSLRAFLHAEGIHYLDLGASKGGSQHRLQQWLTRARVSDVANSHTRVLGLDISDSKLGACNANASQVRCAKADLREIAGSKDFSEPIVRGVQMLHVLEHINQPVTTTAFALVPASRRNWHRYDTSVTKSATELLVSASKLSKRFTYVEGPAFDGEAWLRERGLVRYFEAWHGHTCHLDTRGVMQAMREVSAQRHGTVHVVGLYGRVASSADPAILPLSKDPKDQQCAEPGMWCDVRNLREELSSKDPSKRAIAQSLQKLKPSPPISFEGGEIYLWMVAISIFDAPPWVSGSRETLPWAQGHPRMHADSALIVLKVAELLKGGKLVHAECRPGLSGASCFNELVLSARVAQNSTASQSKDVGGGGRGGEGTLRHLPKVLTEDVRLNGSTNDHKPQPALGGGGVSATTPLLPPIIISARPAPHRPPWHPPLLQII